MSDHSALIAEAERRAAIRFPEKWIHGTFSFDSNAGNRSYFKTTFVEGAEFAASVPALPTREQVAEALYYHSLGTAAALEWNAWDSKHPATKDPWYEQADAILSLLTNSKES